MKVVSIIMFTLCLFITNNAKAAPPTGLCSVTTTPVAFGVYDISLATPTNSTGTITVTCDVVPKPNVIISIGPTTAPSSGFNPRTMKFGVNLLNYNLYTDAAYSLIWGDGTLGTNTVTLPAVPRNTPKVTTVYGRITAGQDVVPGVYGETLTVTITY